MGVRWKVEGNDRYGALCGTIINGSGWWWAKIYHEPWDKQGEWVAFVGHNTFFEGPAYETIDRYTSLDEAKSQCEVKLESLEDIDREKIDEIDKKNQEYWMSHK